MGIVVEPRARKLAPTNDVDAQFSLPFAVGLGIVHRRASLDEYAAATLRDPDVLAVAERTVSSRGRTSTRCSRSAGPRSSTSRPPRAASSRRHGRAKGDPGNPLTPEEARDKFRSLAGAALPAPALEAVEEAVRTLEDAPGVGDLVSAVVGAGVR